MTLIFVQVSSVANQVKTLCKSAKKEKVGTVELFSHSVSERVPYRRNMVQKPWLFVAVVACTVYRWRTFVSVTFRYVVPRLRCQHEAEGRV